MKQHNYHFYGEILLSLKKNPTITPTALYKMLDVKMPIQTFNNYYRNVKNIIEIVYLANNKDTKIEVANTQNIEQIQALLQQVLQ